MTQDLTTMQKHLTIARGQATELRVENSALQVQVYELGEKLRKTKRRYRTTIVILTTIALWLGYTNMQYGAENRWFANQLKESNNLQQRFDNVLGELHIQNARVLELESANEQLIGVCEPRSVVRAIKATPLPKLVLL